MRHPGSMRLDVDKVMPKIRLKMASPFELPNNRSNLPFNRSPHDWRASPEAL